MDRSCEVDPRRDNLSKDREGMNKKDAAELSVTLELRRVMENAIEAHVEPAVGILAYSVVIGSMPLPEGDHPQWVKDGLAALRRFDELYGLPKADDRRP